MAWIGGPTRAFGPAPQARSTPVWPQLRERTSASSTRVVVRCTVLQPPMVSGYSQGQCHRPVLSRDAPDQESLLHCLRPLKPRHKPESAR